MSRAIAAIWGSVDATQWPAGGIGQSIAAYFKELAHKVVSPYRPEKHYMRGPGPAWQAKYGKLPNRQG